MASMLEPTESGYPNYEESFTKTDAQQLGRIVIGVRLDRHSARLLVQNGPQVKDGTIMYDGRGQSINEEIVGITEYDLVFEDREKTFMQPASKRYSPDVREGQLINVFSSFNGMVIRDDKLEAFAKKVQLSRGVKKEDLLSPEKFADAVGADLSDLRRLYLYDRFRFVGVANQDEKFDKNKIRTATGLAAAIGGTISIRNTGRKNILVGDRVQWRLPSSHDVENKQERRRFRDIHRDKIVAQVEPFNNHDVPVTGVGIWEDIFLGQITNLLGELGGHKKGSEDYNKSLAGLSKITLKLASWHLMAASERCFAVALSSAKPGQMFDIQLSRNMFLS